MEMRGKGQGPLAGSQARPGSCVKRPVRAQGAANANTQIRRSPEGTLLAWGASEWVDQMRASATQRVTQGTASDRLRSSHPQKPQVHQLFAPVKDLAAGRAPPAGVLLDRPRVDRDCCRYYHDM